MIVQIAHSSSTPPNSGWGRQRKPDGDTRYFNNIDWIQVRPESDVTDDSYFAKGRYYKTGDDTAYSEWGIGNKYVNIGPECFYEPHFSDDGITLKANDIITIHVTSQSTESWINDNYYKYTYKSGCSMKNLDKDADSLEIVTDNHYRLRDFTGKSLDTLLHGLECREKFHTDY